MDERVNCMACLVANEKGMINGAVATIGVVTHALTHFAGARRTFYRLCAFHDTGTLRPGTYWESRVDEKDIEGPPEHGNRST